MIAKCKGGRMMKTKKIFIAFGVILISHFSYLTSSFAQDVHFSQFSMTPLLLNPALTGVYDGDHRAFLNYKNQWKGMGANGAAFNTAMVSYDAGLFKKRWKKGYLGAGFDAYKDVAGDLKLGTTRLNLSLAGVVYINDKQLLSGGLQAGYVQKSISTGAMQWDSQYDEGPGTYNSSLPSNDIVSIPAISYGDFSAGLSWNFGKKQSSMAANDELKINFGLAALNVNSPKQNFLATGNKDELYKRFVVHGASRIGLKNTSFALMPNAILFLQGPSYEVDMGLLVRWSIKNMSRYTGFVQGMALSAGAHYRLNDAVIPMVLFEFSNYAIGLSYDVNTSSLIQGTHGRGGFEISLRFITPNSFGVSSTRLLD